MKFSSGEVAHLAKLSRLELSESEQERIGQDLEEILGYVAKLDELDVSQVEAQVPAPLQGLARVGTLSTDKGPEELGHVDRSKKVLYQGVRVCFGSWELDIKGLPEPLVVIDLHPSTGLGTVRDDLQ